MAPGTRHEEFLERDDIADLRHEAGTEDRTEDGARTRYWWTWIVAALVAVAGVLVAVGWYLAGADSLPAEGSPEAGFARDMQVHHAQAVEMALIVREKSNDPQLRSLAYDIATSQEQQMGQMYAWLTMWGLPQAGTSKPMTWMRGMDHSDMGSVGSMGSMGTGSSSDQAMGMSLLPDGRMPGMASAQDMQRLREATGKRAEVLFLRLMRTHHQAGVMMADAILQKTDEPVVRTLARSIVTSQSAEIQTMTSMLAERGAASNPAKG